MGVDLLDQKLSGVAETWWDAGGILHARTPTHSPLDVKTRINYTQTTMNFKTHAPAHREGAVLQPDIHKTRRSTTRSLYTLLNLCVFLFYLLLFVSLLWGE
jgi:hypothetical protein